MAPGTPRARPARRVTAPVSIARPIGRLIALVLMVTAWVAAVPRTSAAGDRYAWPVRGPVIRGFEEPSGPFGPGHRGIDIAVPFGTEVHAAQDGIVAFAGWVAGSLFVSIDHADGIRTTYSWLSAVAVRKGSSVSRGQAVGASGHGHPEEATPHLHFGARIGTRYIDPMTLLGGVDLVHQIHLAPLGESSAGSASGSSLSWRTRYQALAGVDTMPPNRYPTVVTFRRRARDPPRPAPSGRGPAPTIAAA